MTKLFKLILIRHAPVKTKINCFPDHDPNALISKTKIKNLANHLPQDCIWYVSPLKRTLQTAKALSKFVSMKEMVLEKKLLEQNYGDWAGKDISYVWKTLKNNKTQHNYSFICPEVFPPNGESFLAQYERVSQWLEQLDPIEMQSVVIIAHSGTIRAALAYTLGIEADKAIGIEISHLSLTIIEVLAKGDNKDRGGRFRVLAVNNTVA